MRNGFSVALLAASLAGCAGTAPQPLPPGQDPFGSFSGEWRRQGGQPVSSALAGTEADQKEFEDWRAWQEWKRKNPK